MSLGDFDECINVRLGKMGKIPAPGEREYFHGKYCTVECRLPKGILDAIDEYESATPERRHNTSIGTSKTFLSMLLKYGQYMKVAAFRFGVCIPSTCDVEDLSSITTTIAKQVGFPLKVLHCQEKRSIEFRSEQTVITIVLTSIILTVLFCTVLEVYFEKFGVNSLSKTQKILQNISQSISVISSTKRLVDVKKDNHPMPIMRGLFLLTVVFNVLGHTYLMYNHLYFFKYSSVVNYYEYMQQFSFSVIANGSNGVENYFFIAGFLITFIRWRKPIDTPKINLPKLIMKPYIRMTFFQLLVIALFLMIPLFGNGPFWGDFVGPYLQSCRDRWWLNLFYIQNYWQSDDTCLYHTWLLAAIMQLYIVAVVVVWFLIKKPNIGFFLIITIVICGMAGVGAVVFIHKLPGALSMYLLDGVSGPQMWNTLFIKTFDHVGSFSIGLVTGYIVAKHKNSFNFGKVTTTVIWCIALTCLLAVMFGLYEYRHGDLKMESSLAILYAMLNRNIYALFLAWFTIACVTGKAGFLPNLLSWKALIPAYRLSFLAYLLHLIVIYYHIGIVRERMYLSHEENIINYFGYLVSTFILAYICYIFFQVPYIYLESLILKKEIQSDEDSTEDIEKDEKCKFGDSNNISLTAKSIKRHMQTLTISSIKDNQILTGIQPLQEKL
ncbi:nose resistant to fluoxetine protein 6 [Trichonephila clavipes]|nr:nose resistant to fluoxetine protein 6 [Trichonephila clavipes]